MLPCLTTGLCVHCRCSLVRKPRQYQTAMIADNPGAADLSGEKRDILTARALPLRSELLEMTDSWPVAQTGRHASVEWVVPGEAISSAAPVGRESGSWGGGVDLQTGNVLASCTNRSVSGPGSALLYQGQTHGMGVHQRGVPVLGWQGFFAGSVTGTGTAWVS